MIWISIIFACILVQIPNLWAIEKFNSNPSFLNAFLISLYTLPFSFLSTAFFSYYYGVAYTKYSYPVISVTAYAFSLFVSIFIHSFILKNKQLAFIDYVSIFFIIFGLCISIFREPILNIFK